MKTFAKILCCIVLLTISRAYAQETFTPLITENTLFFAHVDFGNVDVDAAKVETKKLADKFLTRLGFDAKSQRLTLREVDVELEKLDLLIRPNIEVITKELGITEIAFIVDEDISHIIELVLEGIDGNMADIGYLMCVVPWKGKTDKDLQTLLSLFSDQGDREFCCPVGDFLFVSNFFEVLRWSEEPVLERIFTDWAKKAAAANKQDLPVLQALKTLNASDEVKIVYDLAQAMRREMNETFENTLPEEMPVEIQQWIRFAVDKTEWVAASLSVSELLFGTEAKEWRLLTIKTPSNADAKRYRELLEGAIEAGIAAARSEAEEKGDETPSLFFEFTKGLMRSMLPAVEGDTLVVRQQSNKISATVIVVGSMTSFLFVQPSVVLKPKPVLVPREDGGDRER